MVYCPHTNTHTHIVSHKLVEFVKSGIDVYLYTYVITSPKF